MPAGMEEFNEITQRAKVAAGFKGGPYFTKPITHPAMTFVEGWPSEVIAKAEATQGITMGTISTPWNASRQGSK